ncbi:MAG: diguanylate cyclase [Planctomycetaceae bacterium]|nr:diguanylate cyclase [Planctomycetaceae bacterium]
MTMVNGPQNDLYDTSLIGGNLPPGPVGRGVAELQALLRELEAVTAAEQTLPPVFSEAVDRRLVEVRLGAAASLFAALRCKSAAAAGHGLRVALSCSAWASRIGLQDAERHAIEVAALLHDVGVIGVPDHVLLKAGTLDADETAVMSQSRRMSLEILRGSCTLPLVLEIVRHVATWYDGSSSGAESESTVSGERIPLGARMIAVVEAYDAITTDRVYRPAQSRERAIAELFAGAGTQFDPELVRQFAEFCREDQAAMHWEAAHRWLASLEADPTETLWGFNAAALTATEPNVQSLFQGRLLDNMYDAVVFIDAAGRVQSWNRGTERLTGVTGLSVRGRLWSSQLLGLSDEKGRMIADADCPVQTAIRCGVQSLRRLTILGRGRRPVAVDAHAIPVIDAQGVSQGAILLFHDASSETSLEQRCQQLHEKATKDPLTQVANRAEFDRVHAMFVAAHQQQHAPCSLMMCDLDRFKRVNDTYGHQAGDDAIRCLASLLKSSCRPGDLVARYGGEEFVLLCADCDNATAARRADQIRKALSQVTQPRMEGRSVTVSFGVTEIQPGDTPETMLRRADRALLLAKSNGRNTVVQLGSGAGEESAAAGARSREAVRSKETLQQDLITPVPVKIAIEKLRGFVADHQAKIVVVDGNRVRLEIDGQAGGRSRRLADRKTTFFVEATFEEERVQRDRCDESSRSLDAGTTRTRMHVVITPRRGRNRRHHDAMDLARDVLVSFRSYLMAYEEEPSPLSGALTRARRILTPWLSR